MCAGLYGLTSMFAEGLDELHGPGRIRQDLADDQHIWLDEVMETVGPDRHVAWHVLGAVLRTVRDRLPLELAAHLGAQLPLLVRGTYYDQFRPGHAPELFHSEDEFLSRIAADLGGTRPVNVRQSARSVLAVLSHHVTPEQVDKVKRSLPEAVRKLWPAPGEAP